MTLSIHPLHVGTFRAFPQSAVTFQRGFGEVRDVAILMFVILGGEHPIVVDTGTTDVESAHRLHGFDLVRPKNQEPAEALRALGVDPGDVLTVVNTHLHWDHSSNNDLFPRARIFVQRDELAYAIAPLDSNRSAFDNTPEVSPGWLRALRRVVPVDGDARLAPGIELIHLPGHTPGSQGVLVTIGRRRFLLAGDFADTFDNWRGDSKVAHFPSGAFTDLHAYWRSYRKVEALACTVIPSHDTALVDYPVIDESTLFEAP